MYPSPNSSPDKILKDPLNNNPSVIEKNQQKPDMNADAVCNPKKYVKSSTFD